MTRSAIRVLVADDEPLARAGVIRLLSRDPEIDVVGECSDGRATVDAIRAHRPDLVVLDPRLSGLDAFAVIREIGPAMPAVVFVSADDAFALRAFDVRAVDYLLKPMCRDRFAIALSRARQRLALAAQDDVAQRLRAVLAAVGDPAERVAALRGVTRLVVRESGRVYFIATSDIDWIEGADYYAKVHASGREHLVRESLTSLAGRLDPGAFFRVHRSAIVHLERVREIRPTSRGEGTVVMESGRRVRLGRGRRDELERLLGTQLDPAS